MGASHVPVAQGYEMQRESACMLPLWEPEMAWTCRLGLWGLGLMVGFRV